MILQPKRVHDYRRARPTGPKGDEEKEKGWTWWKEAKMFLEYWMYLEAAEYAGEKLAGLKHLVEWWLEVQGK